MPTTIAGLDGLYGLRGQHLGYSAWHQLAAHHADAFARAVGDRHTLGDSGGTDPYLVMSLVPALLREIYSVSGVGMALNYGLNQVRFLASVPEGASVRAGATLDDVEAVRGGAQVTLTVRVDIENGVEPACVVEMLSRYLV